VAATSLGSAAEVLVATGHDPFARSSLRRPMVRGWSAEGATAWLGVDPDDRTPYLSTLGAPEAVAALLGDLLRELPPRQRVTVPHGTPRHLPAWVGLEGTDWDFRWLDAPPSVQPGEELVGPEPDEAAVQELLAASSPTASAQPGDAAVRRWVGVRDLSPPDGRLIACAADTSGATGVGHLSSIAVHPDARGRGLGRAVTAALTRQLFEDGNDLVTLGMYASNSAGRALYDALGYADEHRFTSGPLLVRGRW
jgi:ribosomal protein S18 acetylase RimI-like enzyme